MGANGDVAQRVERVVAAVESAGPLMDFLTTTVAALEEHLGYAESAFMLALAGDSRAYAGVKHGGPEYVLEEYFERWADDDALTTTVGRRAYAHQGWATIGDVYGLLDAPRRRYVDDFLRRTRLTGQLSLRIPGRFSEGYLTVMGPAEFEPRDRQQLLQLVPALAEGLRRRLPVGLERYDFLSLRERQVCELVALGFTNRQIADVMHIEEDTVKKHVSRALARVEVHNRTNLAVAWATGQRLEVAAGASSH